MIDYLKGTEKILKASEKETEKYDFKTLGKKFIGHPKVFPAKYFSDSKFFGKILPIEKNQIFLENRFRYWCNINSYGIKRC